jgi:hypothetical protein
MAKSLGWRQIPRRRAWRIPASMTTSDAGIALSRVGFAVSLIGCGDYSFRMSD